MRTIEQAHTYITQGLQRQGAFKKDYQYSQAVDFNLNKAMLKFVRGCIKPSNNNSNNFEVNDSRRQDIQSLIVLNKRLITQKLDDNYLGILPSDFKFLLNDRSSAIEDCKKSFVDSSETKA